MSHQRGSAVQQAAPNRPSIQHSHSHTHHSQLHSQSPINSTPAHSSNPNSNSNGNPNSNHNSNLNLNHSSSNLSSPALSSPYTSSPYSSSPQNQFHVKSESNFGSPNAFTLRTSHSLYSRQNAVVPQYFTPTALGTPSLGTPDSLSQASPALLNSPYMQLYHSNSLTDSVSSASLSTASLSSGVSGARTVNDAFFPDLFSQNSAQAHSPSSPSDTDVNGHHRNPFLDKSLCVVCGDRARGCNFGAITCASCKEFFRRNAFKFDKLRCYFQNKCEINMHSRRFCAACRLIKCNQSGMKSDYIMSEQEKLERQQKIVQRKISRQVPTKDGHSVIPESVSNPYEAMYIQTSQIENNAFKMNNNNLLTRPNAASGFTDETESQIKALMKKVKIIRESHYYQSMFQLHLHQSQSEKALQMNEDCKIRYLTTVVQIMQAETISEMPHQSNKSIDLPTLTEIVMFNFIKLCKKLSGYNNLGINDQIKLVRGRSMESLILWSTMIIDLEKEGWEIMDVERNIKFSLKLETLREANPTLYDEHRQYVSSFEDDWRFNEVIMSLLMVITLFDIEGSPEPFDDPDAIKKVRQDYSKLLRNYLGLLYEDSVVERNYSRILTQVGKTKEISEKHMRAHWDVVPDAKCKEGDYRGYIMEIFDLNN